MQPKTPIPAQPPGISLGDVYYVLFKRKWLILFFSLLGIGAAASLYFLTQPPFVSEAKLLVRYVQDAKAPGDEKARPVSLTSDAIMNTEASILGSLDVAATVIDILGAEKILGKGAVSTNRNLAAATLQRQLTVEVPAKGNVLRVAFRHHDVEVVQPVLRQLIDAYFKKHVEIHSNLGFMDDMLNRQADSAKSRLAETEESLRKLKSDYQITSLDDAKRQLSERLSRVSEELRNSEVDLEQQRASLKELQRVALTEGGAPSATNSEAPVAQVKASPEVVAEYQRLLSLLTIRREKEQTLLTNFRPDSRLVVEARANVEELEKQKKQMIEANPSLVQEQAVARVAATPMISARDIRAEEIITQNTRIAALVAKIKILNAQLAGVKADISTLDKAEKEMVPLQRKKELDDSNYRYLATGLNQARFDSSLAGGQLSNIKEVQSPSLPFRDTNVLIKKVAMTAIAGIALGFGLAFLLELVVDQSIRRPAEVEQKYKLPTFMTIPRFSNNGRGPKQPLRGGAAAALPEGTAGSANGNGDGSKAIAPWEEEHHLHPYSEALRDRLMSFFELKGLTHKPKLVALTSCSAGAGVTSIAAGLAASLSETGEGNVLLVDMNSEQGAAHPFFRGKPACGLADVLEHDKRPAALIQENLYAVQGALADERLPQMLPKRIRHLIPKLQTSDYDYIIFDMPPITQTSVTPRLAAFMDMVFLVVEDGKTSREWLKHASSLLLESKANVGAVFNKRNNPVPKWLHQEF